MQPIPNSFIIDILEASTCFTPDVIVKIKRLAIATPPSEMIDKMVNCNLLSSEIGEKMQDFLRSLFSSYGDGSNEMTIFSLPEDKKKDIVFARRVLTEGLCSVADINKSFLEQASLENKLSKKFRIGQILVKNLLIPANQFGKIHREVEEKAKNANLNQLITLDKSLRVSLKEGTIHFDEGSIPEKFGPFRIITEIARGGMGVVYKAWDPKLRRTLALKVLKAWEDPPLSEIQRFHREARLAARLSHPNIVKIYQAGVVDSVHYYTMDCVEGETLSEYLEHTRPTPRQALIIVRDIALALDYAHNNSVIHRDVKPANIMLDASNKPLLTDFGLAKGTHTGDSLSLTKSGAALGTPAYMSPEQARGTGSIDARSDIYSLGAVLYHLLTSKPPFEADSLGVVLSNVLSKEPLLPSKVDPNIPPDIEAICLKTMAKDTEYRYQTAMEVFQDIDRYLYGETISVKKMSFSKKLWRKISKNVAITVLLLVTFSILGLGFGWIWLKNHLASEEAGSYYNPAEKLIKSGEVRKALPKLWKASRHDAFHAKVIALFERSARFYTRKGSQKLVAYQQSKNLLKKLQASMRGQERKNFAFKRETLKKMAELEKIQQKNFFSAIQNFRQSLIYQPFNKLACHYLAEIYLQKNLSNLLFENHVEKPWFLQSFYFYRQHSNLSYKGTLTIRSSPGKAKVYLFSIRNEYFRFIPVGCRLKSQEVEKLIKVDTRQIRKGSYIGETPLKTPELRAGYYLLILEKNDHLRFQTLVKIPHRKNYTYNFDLPVFSKDLEGFAFIPNINSRKQYFLSNHEVSFLQYKKFLNAIGSSKGKDFIPFLNARNVGYYENSIFQYYSGIDEKKPVVGITWEAAKQYCRWLSHKANFQVKYTLPTLKIWRIAAGERDGRKYPWGNHFDFCFTRSIYEEEKSTEAHRVGRAEFDVSPCGVYDMAGNVREWCRDIEKSSNKACVAGGSPLFTDPICFQIDYFSYYPKNYKASDVGFRVMGIKRKYD